jgi:hypothetical protein
MMATLEDAQKCSKCAQNGEITSTGPAPNAPGKTLLMITCRNAVCPWYETAWPVQVNADGTIPDPPPPGQVRGAKQYTTEAGLLRGDHNRYIDQVNQYAQYYDGSTEREV